MTGPIRHVGILLAVVAAFAWGIVLEAAPADDVRRLWVAVIALPLVLLITALAASFSEKTSWVTAISLGAATGYLAAAMLTLGAFSLFALEVDGRELNGFGDSDLTWQGALVLGLLYFGAGGAVLGAVCGAAARALRAGLAQWPRPGP